MGEVGWLTAALQAQAAQEVRAYLARIGPEQAQQLADAAVWLAQHFAPGVRVVDFDWHGEPLTFCRDPGDGRFYLLPRALFDQMTELEGWPALTVLHWPPRTPEDQRLIDTQYH